MPYLVTTRREGRLPGRDNDAAWSRRAVATLEDASTMILALLDAAHLHGDDFNRPFSQIPGESGGTVGPLPDGTIIEVERVLWRTLREQLGDAGLDGSASVVLEAFNAKQAS